MIEEAPFGFGTLEAGSAKLPVKRIEIHSKVSGVHAHVLLEQLYVNDRASLLEVTYVFPLPGLGAVSSYAFTVDGVTTRGTLHEREEARAIYDTAIAAGQAASTLEEDRPEVMTVRVGNLPPGSSAWVSIGMDLILPIADDRAVFRLPLLVGARYVPGSPLGGAASGDGIGLDTYDAPDASRVTPPRVTDPGIRVGVMIDAFGATDVLGTHALDVERKHDRLRIAITDTLPDGDIVLQFPLPATNSALFCPDPTGDRGTLVVTACTALPADDLPLEVAVLLDRSGSMDGEKMTLARRAASWIVEGLTPRDRVLPLAFDHEIEAPLGNQLVQAFASQRRRAIEWFERVEARGGTVIGAPLQLAAAAFERRGHQGRRAIVLITDGQVANEDQLVAIAARADVQLLAVAIGPAANQGLCMRLARATGGGCEAAPQDAQLGGALDRLVRRLLAPVLEELDISLEGATIEPNTRTPAKSARAIAGVPAVLAVRTIGTPTSVMLRAIDPKGAPVRKPLPVETIDLPSLQRVWARSRLRDLEDRVASSVFPNGFPIEDELIETSLAYGVLCRYTAFVAVDNTVRDRGLPREKLVQPVIATERSAGGDAQMQTRSGTLRGKPSYLSPEQVTGHPAGLATDVFALAVILQELAMRERVFAGDSEMAILVNILQTPAPKLPLAYAALQPLFDRALAKEPANRFADARELAEAFARLPADRTGLAELAQQHYQPPSIPGPVKARSRAWWVTKKLSEGYDDIVYAATYAGPLADPWPDAIVRVKGEYAVAALPDPLAVMHPNIAAVYGVLRVPDRAQVIEYVRGVDLSRLRKTALTLGQLTAIAQDITAAVAAIHAHGVAYRDLQPTKFVLSTAGRCILVAHAPAPVGTPLPVLPIALRGLGALIP